jgi:hypothetical protein
MRMLDGFNEGWIKFEERKAGSLKGKVELETVLKGLIKEANGLSVAADVIEKSIGAGEKGQGNSGLGPEGEDASNFMRF